MTYGKQARNQADTLCLCWELTMSNGFEEAGRRIKAAIISYLMGDKGVDRTLKELPEDPGEYWSDQAEKLVESMNAEVVEQMLKSKRDSEEIQKKSQKLSSSDAGVLSQAWGR
jgi:hypothetical protein